MNRECCQVMKNQFIECEQHGHHCPRYVIKEITNQVLGNSLVFVAPDGGFWELNFCPWCGTKQTQDKNNE